MDILFNGQVFSVARDGGSGNKELAASERKQILEDSRPVPVWYDQADPGNATFEEPGPVLAILGSMLGMQILLLMYFRWYLLKYYELKLEEEWGS